MVTGVGKAVSASNPALERSPFAGLSERLRAQAAPITAAVLSLLLALFYYRAWVLHLGIPLDLSDDSLDKLQKVVGSVRNGWFLYDSTIGLPGGGQRIDFPRYDSLNFAAIKAIAWLVGDPVVATNLFVLGGFGAVAATACWAFERFGIRAVWAVAGGVLYAWLPYHQLRGFAHFTNGFYALVPLALWLLWATWHAPSERKPGWLVTVTIAALLVLQNPYYGLFFVVIAATYAAVAILVRGVRASRLPLQRTAVVLGVVGITFVLEQTPRLLFEQDHGPNVLALVRLPLGPSEFALSLTDMVNPSPDHPIRRLGEFTQNAAGAIVGRSTERSTATLPWFGFLGLFIATASSLRLVRFESTVEPILPLLSWTAATAFIAILWAHQGALCTVLAELGLVSVRGWNRMSVWIAFCGYAAATAWSDIRTRSWPRWASGLAIGIISVVLIGERMMARPRADFSEVALRFQDAREFARTLAGDGRRRAFIVPYLPYPETGERSGVQDYAHFILPIVEPRLAISYGSMRGRGSYYFAEAANGLSGRPLVEYLGLGGFDAVIVDRRATAAPAMSRDFEEKLGPARAMSRQFIGYALPGRGSRPVSSCTWRNYELRTLLDFSNDPTSRRFLDLNFSEFEIGGTWTLSKLANLRFCIPDALPGRLVLEISGILYEPRPALQNVGVFFDDQPVCMLTQATAQGRDPANWRCEFSPPRARSAEHELRLVVGYPWRPVDFGEPGDARELGFRLASLRIVEATAEAASP
jgi:phosphoglycerol transferase